MFKYLLGLSALFLASCGAFFSVKGIGLLFSGSFWSSIIMASSLEFGKIMATSFLYRYWENINKIIKIYLLAAVIILMGITSLGIFGFLSQAFYSTKSSIDSIESQIILLEDKKKSLQLQLSSNNERIASLTDTRKNQESNLTKVLDQSTTTTVTKSGGLFSNDTQEKIIDKKSVELKSKTLDTMQNSISSLESNIEKINQTNDILLNEISAIDNSIISLKEQVTKSDIGTYRFIATAFNTEIESIVKYFIIIIVFVFDPLAVSLLIAFNIVNKRQSNSKEIPKEKINNITTEIKESTQEEAPNSLITEKKSTNAQEESITSKLYKNFNYTNRIDQ